MKFYTGNFIDSQGRFNLSGYIKPQTEVVCYITEEDFDLVHIVPYDGKNAEVKDSRHRVDGKGRFILPSAFRRKDAFFGYIAKDPTVDGGVVVKLLRKVPD